MEDKLSLHLSHPFYSESKEIWEKVRIGQIAKGAEKYPEPFTPSSWSGKELAIHAIQENVDQLHYIVGMLQALEEKDRTIEELKARLKEWEEEHERN